MEKTNKENSKKAPVVEAVEKDTLMDSDSEKSVEAEVTTSYVSSEDSNNKSSSLKKSMKDTGTIIRLTWAFVLIGIGIILLLSNFGSIPDGLWMEILSVMFKLWPLFLIIAGLQVIFGRNWWSKVVVTVLVLILLSFVFSLSMFKAGVNLFKWVGDVVPAKVIEVLDGNSDLDEYKWTSDEDISELEELEMTYTFVTADFLIKSDENTSDALFVDGEYLSTFGTPAVSHKLLGDISLFEFTNTNRKIDNVGLLMRGESYNVTFLPLDKNSLILDANVVDGEVELSSGDYKKIDFGLNVGSLVADIGEDVLVTSLLADVNVGDIKIDVNSSLVESMALNVDVGSLYVYFDNDTNYRVILNYNVNLGSLSVFGEDLTGSGSKIISDGDGGNEIVIDVEVNLGKVVIE